MIKTDVVIFVAIAAFLSVFAGFWLLRPLWRDKAARVTAAVSTAVLATAAVALYVWSSHWTWPQEDTNADSPAAMVSRLAKRLESEPNDVQGWLMLGRSYTALGQLPLAQRAYQRADRLESGRNVEALIGMAEAMVMQSNGAVDPRAARMFEQALTLEPNSEKALFYSAVAAQRRGETPLAISRFEKMLQLDPPENVRNILQQQIVALRASIATGGASGTSAPGAGPAAAAAVSETPHVLVAVSIKPALAREVAPGSTLFVFVRAPGRPGPPLAVKRLPATLPVSVELTSADSMVPGLSFAPNDTVEVSAKISADGSATPKSGDLVGRVRYIVGRDFKKSIVIDGRTP
ncbi:MAG: tetratricopeptide repeat protein [Steroidobacteraceae bacterium]